MALTDTKCKNAKAHAVYNCATAFKVVALDWIETKKEEWSNDHLKILNDDLRRTSFHISALIK